MKAISIFLKALSVALMLADVHDAFALVSAFEEASDDCDEGLAARVVCLDTTVPPWRRCALETRVLTDSARHSLFPEARHSLLLREHRRGSSAEELRLAGADGTADPTVRVSTGSMSVGPGYKSFVSIQISISWDF